MRDVIERLLLIVGAFGAGAFLGIALPGAAYVAPSSPKVETTFPYWCLPGSIDCGLPVGCACKANAPEALRKLLDKELKGKRHE